MITGDLATDAWLARHCWDIAAAVCFAAVIGMVLPGLAVLLGQEDDR